MNSNMDIIEFERRVMTALLVGNDPIITALRNQYAAASVVNREFSGVGFFTTYSVPSQLPRIEPPNFEVSDIQVEVLGTIADIGIVLFVRDGKIDFLEGYTYAGLWPDNLELLSLKYVRQKPGALNEIVLSEERDLEFARRQWKGES